MPKRKPKKQNIPMFILIAGGALLLIFAVWLLLQNQTTPAPIVSNANAEETYPDNIERVSIADARTALEAGTALFVDVRIADAYNLQRITGALNMPEAEIGNRLSELDPNQWIITYCT
jgi:hypothetical protein